MPGDQWATFDMLEIKSSTMGGGLKGIRREGVGGWGEGATCELKNAGLKIKTWFGNRWGRMEEKIEEIGKILAGK